MAHKCTSTQEGVFFQVTISDYVVVLAIVVAPILAVQIQKFLENRKEEKARKMRIFRSLMATRATPVSPQHIEALNMIDIEFYKNKKVTGTWKLLLDSFESYPKDPNDKYYQAMLQVSSDRSRDLLTDLLYEMSKSLGYDFDKVLLKRGCYVPKGHGDIELESTLIRRGLVEILLGVRPLPIVSIQGSKQQDSSTSGAAVQTGSPTAPPSQAP